MKATILVLLSFFSFSANAQFALRLTLDFDTIGQYQIEQFGGAYSYYTSHNTILNIDTVQYPNNRWQIGRPNKTVFDSAYSFPNAIVTDTANPCTPNDTSVFYLKVPKYAWIGLSCFSFKYKLDIDSTDIAKIEFSSDTGINWTDITHDTLSSFVFGYLVSPPRLDSTTPNWLTVNIYPHYDIDIATDTFIFRFTYIAGSSINMRDGWIMDNFMMNYAGASVNSLENNAYTVISPNPASDKISIHCSDKIKTLTITDILGRVVYSIDPDGVLPEIHIKTLLQGIYFVKVNGLYAGKFLKE